jgi:hypothetical protein
VTFREGERGLLDKLPGFLEGIRTLEIPAPYYGDRVRRQFPPSSRVRVSSLFVFTVALHAIPCPPYT